MFNEPARREFPYLPATMNYFVYYINTSLTRRNPLNSLLKRANALPFIYMINILIIKITISSLVIGFKKAYFPLIRWPSCYRTVCYWIVCYWTVCYRTVQKANHIQRCSLKQPITFKVVITCACACASCCVFAFSFFVLFLYFNANFPLFHNLAIFLGNCNFYD